jgi:competence protein ComEC
VLSVTTPAGSLLLPGDISRAVERRLARLASRGHEVIVVPHHGSRSSSSADWLAWTRPQQALVSAGWGNRFGFPHAEVSQRHQQQGSALLGTAECGALRIRLGADGSLQTESARRLRKGIWRWPAASHCP